MKIKTITLTYVQGIPMSWEIKTALATEFDCSVEFDEKASYVFKSDLSRLPDFEKRVLAVASKAEKTRKDENKANDIISKKFLSKWKPIKLLGVSGVTTEFKDVCNNLINAVSAAKSDRNWQAAEMFAVDCSDLSKVNNLWFKGKKLEAAKLLHSLDTASRERVCTAVYQIIMNEIE